MIRLRHKLLIQVFRLFDQFVLMVTAVALIYLRPEIAMQGGARILDATFKIYDTLGLVVLVVGWVAIFDYFIRYKADRLVALNTQLKSLIKATSLSSFWLMLVAAVFSVKSFNVVNLLIFFAVVTAIGIVSRLSLRVLLLSARRSGYNYRFLLVVGANARALQIAGKIEEKPELGYKIVGFVAENDEARERWEKRDHRDWKIVGSLDNFRKALTDARVDEVIACLPVDARFSDITMVIRHAKDLGIVVRLMPELADGTLLRNMHVEEFEDECVVTLFRERMLVQLLLKRLLDASLSVIVLLMLAPLMLLVALLIKLTSPGPVFFVQKRVGMNQRHFNLLKFRSMVVDAEAQKKELTHLNERDGPAFKMENDPRITRIGKFLRKTSIDELPQLFNVLSGEMSLVGPRPPLPEEVKAYEWLFRKRLSVKPGITCIWQISGRNNVSFDRWMEMDHEYIENWSLLLDLEILLKTVPAVLLSRGAS
ncbi:MAG: sugar transferase [Verrucomicrobiota bacterium JB025]|nr:sugar transferase [Verrucomicrobiota bacterium JB025]